MKMIELIFKIGIGAGIAIISYTSGYTEGYYEALKNLFERMKKEE